VPCGLRAGLRSGRAARRSADVSARGSGATLQSTASSESAVCHAASHTQSGARGTLRTFHICIPSWNTQLCRVLYHEVLMDNCTVWDLYRSLCSVWVDAERFACSRRPRERLCAICARHHVAARRNTPKTLIVTPTAIAHRPRSVAGLCLCSPAATQRVCMEAR
jgi:hypothetical protein